MGGVDPSTKAAPKPEEEGRSSNLGLNGGEKMDHQWQYGAGGGAGSAEEERGSCGERGRAWFNKLGPEKPIL